MTDHPDLSTHFADLTVNTRFDDIQEASCERAKQSILDTLGVIIAASSLAPNVRPVAEMCFAMGGKEEASILGFEGSKIPALNAAFVNGAMAHCLDFDDHAPEGHHPSSSIVPVIFALAERKGGVSGKEMIAATAIGQDIFLRLRRNVEWKQDWHLTTILGVFSATAAAARVMGLDHAQVISALGIAGTQASGTMELAYGTGSDLRGMYAGFISKQAVLSAMMAERGVMGPSSIFEGKAGFFATYLDNVYDREGMLKDIGKIFTGHEVLFKAWPSCGLTHSYIHATASLMSEQNMAPEEIREIRVHVGDFQERLCIPQETRRAPKVEVDAKFSIPWCVGVAAVHRTARLMHFTPEGMADPRVLSVAAKVVPVRDDGQNWGQRLPHARIEVTTNDGRHFERIGDKVPGEIETPMDWSYLIDKFREAASLSHKPLPADAVNRAQSLVLELETVDDATAIMRALT